MTKRTPTPEELALWRTSNRFTQAWHPESSLPPCGLGAEWGEGDGEHHAPTSPHLTSPARGEELPRAPSAVPTTDLTPLSTRETRRRMSGAIEATLDLHGLTKLEAYGAVASFIRAHHAARRRHVLIITGKGRAREGVLRAALPEWLNEPRLRPLIAAMAHGRPEKGGDGVMHVLLKKHA